MNSSVSFYFSLMAVCVLLTAGACTDHAVIDQSLPVPNHSWKYTDKLTVAVPIDDTSTAYNIFINLRHTASYPYANIYLLIHQQYPSGRLTTVRKEITLANADGRWLGTGSGNLYHLQHLFAKEYHFTDTGTYLFSFEQHMRENPLQGISDVGLRIEPAVIKQ